MNFAQFAKDYLWRMKIGVYAACFLPHYSWMEENEWATIASYLLVLTFGLVYYTPIWTYLDKKCVEACDMDLWNAMFDACHFRMSGSLNMFVKDGFHDACVANGIPTPQTFPHDNLPPNEKVWVKENNGCCGRGHFIHDTNEEFPESNPEDYVFQEICEPSEEIMRFLGHKHMATIRVQTLSLKGSTPEGVGPYILRVGPPGSICDNDTTRPGRYILFLAEDGTIEQAKTWPQKEILTTLPNGLVLEKGTKLAGFEKVVPLCVEAHKRMAPQGFSIGWDVALTNKGIRLIEANYCSPVIEYFRPELFKDLNPQKPDHLDWILSTKIDSLSSKLAEQLSVLTLAKKISPISN